MSDERKHSRDSTEKLRSRSSKYEPGTRRRRHGVTRKSLTEVDIKRLTPLYKRRIFFDQLRHNWYWIAGCCVAVVGLSVALSMLIITSTDQSGTAPPPPPVHGRWGIVKVNGRSAMNLMKAMKNNDTEEVKSAEETMKSIYQKAGVDVDKVNLFSFNTMQRSMDNSAVVPTNKDTIVFDHTVFLAPNASTTVTESEMSALIRSVRKVLANNASIVVDPNVISARRGGTTVRAHSVATFLDKEFPPLDLQMRSTSSVTPRLLYTSCPALPKLPLADVSPEDCLIQRKVYTGLTCTTQCKNGGILSGSRIRTCLSQGVWSGWPTRCEKPCPPLMPPSNGMIIPPFCSILENKNHTPILGGQACYFSCNPGYKLVGSIRIACGHDGRWSGPVPICKRTCVGLSPPKNGHVVPKTCYQSWVLEETFCTFYCDDGFTIRGDATTSCLGSGKWTVQDPFCSRTCPVLKELENTKVQPSACWKENVEAGTHCLFECLPGYDLVGSNERSCEPTGNWSGSDPLCLKMCPMITHQENLVTSHDCVSRNSAPGTICSFSCEKGFIINGPSDVTCLKDGSWDSAVPSCSTACTGMSNASIGHYVCTGTSHGSVCTLYCPEKHELIGARSVTCNVFGSWNEPIGFCLNTCKKYQVPEHGTIDPVECGVQVSRAGQVCTFQCNAGYGLSGPTETMCNNDGEWNSNSTACIRQTHYLIQLNTTLRRTCLKMDQATSTVFKLDWSECVPAERFAKWTVLESQLIKNAEGDFCLAAESAKSMSLLTVKQCDDNDTLQVWEWPSNAHNTDLVKLNSSHLYAWEGYGPYSRVLLINDTASVRATWRLYDISRNHVISFYGATHNGECQPLRDGENGRWTPSTCSSSGTKSQSYCTYVCNTGFTLLGAISEIQCVNGIWSIDLTPQCVPDCPSLTPNTESPVEITPSECTEPYVKEETACAVNCTDNSTLQLGEKYTICMRGGLWSFSLPTCVGLCPALAAIGNGIIENSGGCTDDKGLHREGSKCEILCDEGFAPPSTSYNCSKGAWDKEVVPCRRKCDPPWTSISNAVANCTSEPYYTEGEVCTADCDVGYDMKGNGTLSCLSTGTWSANPPVCKKYCDNCVLSDNSTSRFLMWNDIDNQRYCMSVIHYIVVNTHEIIMKPWSECNSSNVMDLWTMDATGVITSVGSSQCLGSDNGTATRHSVQLFTCDHDNVKIWKCLLRYKQYLLSADKFYLRHEPTYHSVGLSIEDNFWRDLLDRNSYNWKATGVDGNEGSICGIGQLECPQIFLTNHSSFSPSNSSECSSQVDVGEYCMVFCDTGPMVGDPDPGTMFNCLANGVWSPDSIDCVYRSCSPIPSPSNATVNDTSCVNSNSTVGTICEIMCDGGFVRHGDNMYSNLTVCLPNGEWSHGPPFCSAICETPVAPSNGSVSSNCIGQVTLLEGSVCLFSCDYDYQLVGNGTLECLSGYWSDVAPSCTLLPQTSPINCAALTSQSNAQVLPATCVNQPTVAHGVSCTLQCDSGYMPERGFPTSLRCQANGEWDGTFGKCMRKCPKFHFQTLSLSLLLASTMDVSPARCKLQDANYEGDFCQPSCDVEGRLMSAAITQVFGPLHVLCNSSGQWEVGPDSYYSCSETSTRRKIKSAGNGLCIALKPNNLLTFESCDQNEEGMFWFNSYQTFITRINVSLCLTADTSKVFSVAVMEICNRTDLRQRWDCDNGELVNHHINKKLSHFHGSNKVHVLDFRNPDNTLNPYSAFLGYESKDFRLPVNVDDSESICRRRRWALACSYQKWLEIENLDANCTEYTIAILSVVSVTSWSCKFECADGMTLIGKSSANCSNSVFYYNDGIPDIVIPSWDLQEIPRCYKPCKSLTLPSYAASGTLNCTGSTVLPNTVCQVGNFSCNTGYLEVGSRTRTCLISGKWSGADLTCYQSCQPLPGIVSGTAEPAQCTSSEILPNTVCSLVCNPGHQVVGNSNLTCQLNGEWNNPQGLCAVWCPVLSPIDHGQISPADCLSSKKEPGDQCSYSCDTGYKFSGAEVRQCGFNGLWSNGTAGKCLRSCPPLPSPINGHISIESGKENAEGSVVMYQCAKNFSVDRNPVRVCQPSGSWSGEAVLCVQKEQFMLLQDSPPSAKICIYSDATHAVRIKPFAECEETLWYFWVWEGTSMIRNAAANKCLKAEYTNITMFLALDICNSTEYQKWKCSAYSNRNILTLADRDLIPAYSASVSVSKVMLYSREMIEFLNSKSITTFTYLQWYYFSPNGSQTAVCQDSKVEYCSKILLNDYLQVAPSVCSEEFVPVDTECSFQCADGFVTRGVVSPAYCLKSGYWSVDPPKCLPSCGELSLDSDIIAMPARCKTSSSFYEGEVCRFECPSGYHLQGQALLICLRNARWSEGLPVCKKTCNPLRIPIFSQVQPSECTSTKLPITEGTNCELKCMQTEHVLTGSKNRTCSADGTWTGTESTCVRPCYEFSMPQNAVVSPVECSQRESHPGATCTISCQSGFVPTIPYYKTCLENGTWSGTLPNCQMHCPVMEVHANHTIIFPLSCTQKVSTAGSQCSVKCDAGYNVIGERSVYCTSTGKWSATLGNCKKKCPVLQKPHHGILHPISCLGQDNFAGVACTVSCRKNFIQHGPVVRTCDENGEWSGSETTCSPGCPPIGVVESANVFPKSCIDSSQPLRGSCVITCRQGYLTPERSNMTTLTCSHSKFWDKPIPRKCLKKCNLPVVKNGVLNCGCKFDEKENLLDGEVCSVKCDPYHVPSTHPTSKCIDGEWNPPISSCTYTPYPLLMIQRIELKSRCVGLDGESVVMKGWDECKNEKSGSRWAWRSQTSIINLSNGLCLTAFSAEVDAPLIVSPCDNMDSLQKWNCDNRDPFRIYINQTALGPSLLYRDSNELTLQETVDSHSLFYTFNPNSDDELGTLCSMRPERGCRRLLLPSEVKISPNDCLSDLVSPGTACRLTCANQDLSLVGPAVIRCKDSGLWTPENVASCARSCPPLPALNGIAIYDNENCRKKRLRAGERCDYKCPDGFVLNSILKGRVCMEDGGWSDDDHVECTRRCPAIERPENGNLSPAVCITKTCKVECDIYYRADGPRVRVCQANGIWSGSSFVCVPDVQFSISTRMFSLKVRMCLTVDVGGKVVKAPCELGRRSQMWRWKSHYALENVQSETCLAATTTHSNMAPQGKLAQASDSPAHSDLIHFRNSSHNSDVHVAVCNVTRSSQRWGCETNVSSNPFRIVLKDYRLFLDAGPQYTTRVILLEKPSRSSRWGVVDHQGTATVCARRDSGICSPFRLLHGGIVWPPSCSSDFITAGTVCEFRCTGHFAIEGSSSAICKKDGFWTQPSPSCLGIDKCPAMKLVSPLSVQPSVCNGRRVREGRTCSFKCPDTHKLIGQEAMLCDHSHIWPADTPSCKLYCPSLSPPMNGNVYPESCYNLENDIGKKCTFNCSKGFDIAGPASLVCGEDGWSDLRPRCVKLCPKLQAPPNSVVVPEACGMSKSSSGFRCSVVCNTGYRPLGRTETECNDGSWSNDLPVCSEGVCPKFNVGDMGIESVSYKGLSNEATVTGSILEFNCENGYNPDEEKRRICGDDGSWVGGEKLCTRISCESLPGLFRGHVEPEQCVKGEQLNPGMVCSFSCDYGFILSGPSVFECQPTGVWSDSEMPLCHDTNVKPNIRNIIIVSVVPNERPTLGHSLSNVRTLNRRCLVASDGDNISPTFDECLPLSPSKLWHWYGTSRIQNSKNQLCWDMDMSDGLLLKNCDKERRSQKVVCGSVDSHLSQLHVSVGEQMLAHRLTSLSDDITGGLEWAALQAEYVGNITEVMPAVQRYGYALCNFMCGGILIDEQGNISTPNFPLPYPADVVCKWTIHVPRKVVVVEFASVQLSKQPDNDGSRCRTDKIVIFGGGNGDEMHSDVIKSVCASQKRLRIRTYHGTIHIEFHSDHVAEDNQQGFSAKWFAGELPPSQSSCGVSDLISVNLGNDSSHGMPWQAAIVTWKLLCDGIIIGQKFVLTAAHCMEHVRSADEITRISVAYKIRDRNEFTSNLKRRIWDRADRLWIHGQYNGETLTNNVAVLRLLNGVSAVGVDLLPICLASPKRGRIERAGDQCLVGSYSKDLLKDLSQSSHFHKMMNATVLSHQNCEVLIRQERGLTYDKKSLVCAEILSAKDHSNSSFGQRETERNMYNDGGFALQCLWNQNWYVVGISNFPLRDVGYGEFHVFTQVMNNYDWIQETIENGFLSRSSIFK